MGLLIDYAHRKQMTGTHLNERCGRGSVAEVCATTPGGFDLLAPEQILHACMILSVESEDGLDAGLISSIQKSLGCDDEDHGAALEHIEEHRDGGNWGGRRDAVLKRSSDRANEALGNGQLPDSGQVADGLAALLGSDDDGEIDPFAELGVEAGAAVSGGSSDQGADLLAAFMEDDDEEEEVVDSAGFLNDSSSISGDPNESESEDDSDDSDDTDEPEDEVDEPEPAEEEEPSPAVSPLAAYEMLMSTCWVDGILDPAEAKLLARKRDELSISFEDHLSLLRKMLEREA